MKIDYRFTTTAFAAVSVLGLSACQNQGDDFISDDPFGGYGDDAGDTGAASTGGDEGGDPGDGDNGGEGGDEIELSEADIIQLEGDTLYALSAYSGLTVVDMSNPDDMQALGNWETDARPFEMYVESGHAFVMFNNWYFWSYDEELDEWSENSSSRLVALDATDPQDIQVTGEFTMPGRIQDSRRVGDILYLVTLQDGWCWQCDGEQKTVVTSLDVSDESNPQVIDQLEFTSDNDNWDWQRSVESTTERMYLASRTWAWEGLGSYIDVVDISAGDGTLHAGDRVQVTGSVFSRWQMDEFEGVLRVISQLGWDDDPVIETFTIESSDSFTDLGTGTLAIPMPESLRSARFDGDRAYAITAEQTDPLFTIDLSDPANPQQRGELEIPGWVYHMETRGDRILALGFDNTNDEGSINVSLFDVANMDDPTLINRVHFGGSWASFNEDQNRVHKAFSILDDENMLLVPYSGWQGANTEGEAGEWCGGNYFGGVQIIDWLDDDLSLRGVIPARGRPRRAFTHRDRIVTMSDVELGAYTYADRDNPQVGDELRLATNVSELVRAGDLWVRIGRDWWSNEQLLEIVGEDPTVNEPIGVIDLGDQDPCGWSWIAGLYAHGDHTFVVETVDRWVNSDYESLVRVTSVDLSDPTSPVVDDVLEIESERAWGAGYLLGIDTDADWIAHQGQHLAILTREPGDYDGDDRVEVIDLSDPTNLSLGATLQRPAGQNQGELSVMSNTVVSWHTEPVVNQPGKVRFYFDRLVLDDDPNWAAPINVPGVVVAYDANAGQAYSVDFQITNVNLSENDCWQHPKTWRYDWDNQICQLINLELEQLSIAGNGATLEQSIDIEGDKGLESLRATASRLFAKVDASHYDDQYENWIEDSTLVIVDLDDDGAVHRHDGEDFGRWWSLMLADQERAVVRSGYGQLGLIDAADPANPAINISQVPGYGCYDAVIDGDTVYCPMGAYGLEAIEW